MLRLFLLYQRYRFLAHHIAAFLAYILVRIFYRLYELLLLSQPKAHSHKKPLHREDHQILCRYPYRIYHLREVLSLLLLGLISLVWHAFLQEYHVRYLLRLQSCPYGQSIQFWNSVLLGVHRWSCQ